MSAKLSFMLKPEPSSVFTMREWILLIERELFPMFIKLPDMQLNQPGSMFIMLPKQFPLKFSLLHMLIKLLDLSKFKPTQCMLEL